MIRKITLALLTAGLSALGGFAQPPGDPVQLNQRPEGWFYSAGRSYLGIDIRDITSDRVSALKLKDERGVEVTMVDQDAPAGKAGLKEHDVILEYNGARVESDEQLRRMIRETPPGRKVALGISRDGNPMTINVELGDRGKLVADSMQHFKVLVPPIPPVHPEIPDFNIDIMTPTYTPALGVQLDNLGRQLGEFFGVKDGQGLLVKSVEKGSPAEKAGMKAGDVIVRADNDKISDRSDLRRVLRAHREGGKLTLGIVRDKHEQNLTVDLPVRKSQDSSSLEFNFSDLDGLDGIWEFEEVEPQVSLELHKLVQQLPRLKKAQMETARIDIQKSLKKMRSDLNRMQKDLQKQLQVTIQQRLI